MILPGMKIAIVMGWLTSVIILVKPWGFPKFKWKCLPVFFGLLYLPFFIVANFDLIYNYFSGHNSTAKFKEKLDRVDRVVLVATFGELLISDLLLRLIFLWKARDFADLLGRLRLYTESRQKNSSNPISRIDIVITVFVYLTTYVSTFFEGMAWYYKGDKLSWKSSTIRDYIGPLAHSIIMAGFFYLPMMIPMKCAFSTILASSAYLSTIIQDYCNHVLDSVSERKWEGMSITTYKGNEIEMELDRKAFMKTNKRNVFTNERRLMLLGRFDIVQDLFALAHGIISPLALVMLGGASIAVVMKAYEVGMFLSMGENGLYLGKDMCHLFNYICYFWILESGQKIADQISECKEKLEDKYLQLSEQTHAMERQALKDIMSIFKYSNWKFTACDFFVVDRSLASGVVSLIMTYVVVLVQLKVQDEPNVIDGKPSTE